MEGTMSEIRMFAGDFAPKSWLLCQGQLLAINANQALFSLLGTTYGGDGRTTFGLPNFTGCVAMGTGNAAGLEQYTLGEKNGTQQVTITQAEMPAHNHIGQLTLTVNSFSESGNSAVPSTVASLTNMYSNEAADGSLKAVNANVTLADSGSNQPISIMQPYLAMNYVICIYGIFPSRP